MYNNYDSGSRSWIGRIPPVTRVLLAINIAVWLGCLISPGFNHTVLSKLGLHYWGVPQFNPIQLVGYQFVHGGFTHLFFNMFALFMFGSLLERVWGGWRYIMFYFVCGVGAGLVQETIWTLTWQPDYIAALAAQNGLSVGEIKAQVEAEISQGVMARIDNVRYYQQSLLTVGASGSIFGLLVGFAFVFPNMPMYVFFIPVPVKAKWVVIGYGLLELAFGASGTMTSVAHFAHLGGMLFALIMIWIWHLRGTLRGRIY